MTKCGDCFYRALVWTLLLWNSGVFGWTKTCPSSTDGSQSDRLIDCYPPQPNKPNATKEFCLAQGCCWNENGTESIVPCVFPIVDEPPSDLHCAKLARSERMACRNPRYNVAFDTREECQMVGCCFDDSSSQEDAVPKCFQPQTNGYILSDLVQTHNDYSARWTATLEIDNNHQQSPFGNPISPLQLTILMEHDRLRVRITDPAYDRYEVESVLVDDFGGRGEGTKEGGSALFDTKSYNVTVTENPFGFAVTRGNTVLFNTTPPADRSTNGLIFENQFWQVTTALPTRQDGMAPWIYGLGEQVGRFPLSMSSSPDSLGDHYTFFSRDRLAGSASHTAEGGQNVYGVHPFYTHIEESGQAHGVFLLNSNALEVVATKTSLTYRSVGGIVDFFVFLGPTPNAVVEQYTDVIGKPALPPYWALGFHLCRWGYQSANETHSVVERMRHAKMPHDVQWNDIDYMDQYLDFTLDPQRYPTSHMQALVHDLHTHHQHYIPIIDPGIASEVKPTGSGTSYGALDSGIEDNVFIKAGNGKDNLVGRVWPGWVHFPDFTHPNASKWWFQQLEAFHQVVEFDGAWIDMNEPSNFCDGERSALCRHTEYQVNATEADPFSGEFQGSSDVAFPFDPYRQPYVPGQISDTGGMGDLDSQTVSMAAHQYKGLHYNLHSLYGHAESIATNSALEKIRGKRSLVVSRSTFSGTGRSAAHWLGDNLSSWANLRESIAGILQMNMFGIPLVGADICGFQGNTTEELCIRWHQLGAFYPFSRNHNHHESTAQAPVDFSPSAQDAIRNALLLRYQLLPYLYSCLYEASLKGAAVVRPLVFEFPHDNHASQIDLQFLWGRNLLISPAVEAGKTKVHAYFPDDLWYDYCTGALLNSNNTIPGFLDLDTPLAKTNVHIRGGSVILTQEAATTTTESRSSSYHMIIALPRNTSDTAKGSLYLDDGESLSTIEKDKYTVIDFSMSKDMDSYHITSSINRKGYDGPELDPQIDSITVFAPVGVLTTDMVFVLGDVILPQTTFDHETGSITLQGLGVAIGSELKLEIKPYSKTAKTNESGSTPMQSKSGSPMVLFFVLFMLAVALYSYKRYAGGEVDQSGVQKDTSAEYELVSTWQKSGAYETVGDAHI